MHILLTGATGFIGGQLLRVLLQRGHQVTACVRNPARARPLPGVRWIAADFSKDHAASAWLPRLAEVEAVINAVGIFRETSSQSFAALHRDAPLALFEACVQAGIKRVVQISALGADAQADTPYHLSKRAADRALQATQLDWWLLRPSLVYGPGGRSMVLFRALAALPWTPLPDGGVQALQPVHIDDVVETVLRCVEGRVPPGSVLDLVGPDTLSLRELLSAWRQWLGLGQLRGLSLPSRWLGLPADGLGRWMDWPLSADALRLLQQARPFPAAPWPRLSGVQPRGFAEALRNTPAQVADLWQARLYFLRPLLCLTIAVTWLSAGLTSAFFYPVAQSYQLLASVGITGGFAPLFLYGAASLDVALGLGTLSTRWRRVASLGQLTVILAYTLIITLFLPEYWLHPFGPVVKNLPLLAATLVLLVLEESP